MPNFTMEQLINAMTIQENIRNFSIVASVDSGKSTLSDSLLCRAGIISKRDAGEKRHTDTMKQEQDRGITIKSVGVTLCVNHDNIDRVLNVIDSPGHVDFSSEVSAALRVTDGAIVLIDTVDGVKAQTKTVLVQALNERIKPVLVINKIDKLFLSLKMQPNDIYNQFVKNIEDVNQVINTYQDPQMVKLSRDQRVDPIRGDVVFATAYHTWGFSLKTFAKIYAPKFKKTISDTMKYLWRRDNFCKFILEPISLVLNCCQTHPLPYPDQVTGKTLVDIVTKLEINVAKTDYDLKGKDLLRCIMGSWIPVADTVIDMAIDHLPSPKIAQAYRAELLYKGPKNDIYYNSIKNCDPNGPLIVYISKMIPTKDNSHFYAFGRVFSGTASASKIKVLTNEHYPSIVNEENENEIQNVDDIKDVDNIDDVDNVDDVDNIKNVDDDRIRVGRGKTYLNDTIQRVVVMMAAKIEQVVSVSAGNTVALDGIDKTMIKSGTIVGDNDLMCHPLKNMVFSVSPVVQYSIKPKKAGDIAKFTDTLKKFVKSDPCLQYFYNEETSEHVLAGAGELHLEVALEQLRTDFLKNIEFTVSDPIVKYCETVTDVSSCECLAKSANKHNRIYMTAQPLGEAIVENMGENGDLPKEYKYRVKYIASKYPNLGDARHIWAFAPDYEPRNILVNESVGVQYLNDVRSLISTGMINNCEKGPICEEPVRGVHFSLLDAKLHSDNVHRGDSQILPAMRNIVYSTILSAKPRLMEPVFRVDISIPGDKMAAVYTVMNRRRGIVKSVVSEANGIMMNVEAEMPVAESFGFIEILRGETSGTGFASLAFSHWQLVPGDPLEDGSPANKIALEIRKRKGRKMEIPKLNDYLDKI